MKTTLILKALWYLAKKANQFRISNPYLFDKYMKRIDWLTTITLTSLIMFVALFLYTAYFVNHIEKPILLIIPTAILILGVIYDKYAQRIYREF